MYPPTRRNSDVIYLFVYFNTNGKFLFISRLLYIYLMLWMYVSPLYNSEHFIWIWFLILYFTHYFQQNLEKQYNKYSWALQRTEALFQG